MKIHEPGIFYDVPDEIYRRDPCPSPSLTQSLVKVLLNQSPAHAKLQHPRLTPPAIDDDAETYNAARAIGNAAHSLIIGRGKRIVEATFDNFQTKIAKNFRADNEKTGSVVILSKHLETAVAMVEAAWPQLNDADCAEAFQIGDGEVVLAWQERGGVWLRNLTDWLGPHCVFDYKTISTSAAPHAIASRAINDGWDIQAATIERGLNVLEPDNAGRRRFRFVVQENEPPYALTVAELGEHWLTMGRKKLAVAVHVWRQCLASDRWPSYGGNIIAPEYPGYAEAQWLMREITMCDAQAWDIDLDVMAQAQTAAKLLVEPV